MKIRFSSDPLVAHEANGLAVRYAASKRNIANWRWRVLVLLVLVPFFIFLARLLYGTIWADMPGFVALEETVLKVPVAGHIVSTATVGQRVNEGDVIAELRNEVLENEYSTLLKQRDETAALTPSASGNRGNRAAKLAVAEAMQAYELSRQQSALVAQLAEQEAATQAEVTAAMMAMASAQRNLRTAQQLAVPKATPVRVAPPEENVRIAEIAAIRESQKIRATGTGIVAQVFGKQGEWLSPGSEVATLRLERPARIEVFVEPSWAQYATVNSWATINFLDGYSHRAQVKEVKMQAQRLPPDRANPLTVRHHSVVVLLEPAGKLPDAYRVNVLPVNVQFDRESAVEWLAFWRHPSLRWVTRGSLDSNG